METRKAKNFLLNYSSMYEMISMDNGKYLVWKLMFPRSGDTFFTVDKSLDMCSWEKMYSILKRVTLQYAVSSELPPAGIFVECCEFWYRLSIEKLSVDIQNVHEFIGNNIDANLLHDEILCVKVYNNEDFEEHTTGEETSCSCARTPTSISRKRTYSVTSVTTTDRRISKSFIPTTPSSSKTANKSTISKREKRPNVSSTSISEPVANCSTESLVEDIFLRYSDDGESEDGREDENGSAPNSSNTSNETQSSSQSNQYRTTAVKKPKVKMDFLKLKELLKDPKYLNGFCYERDASNDCGNRTFNVYSVNDKITYAAFHSPHMVNNIRDRSDCKLFFCFSVEMLHRFHNLTEMQFDGIEAVLMVYVNHISDRVRPFGYFLLPNNNAVTLSNVVQVIDEWLNPDGTDAMNVTKCVTPQDGGLHQAITDTWPQAKLIGCSDEYQKDIKLFARRNKGLNAENAELTKVACFLCYLPDDQINKGIELIRRSDPSEYGMKLAQYLKTMWIVRPMSIYGEDIVYRTLTVCNRFGNQMMRNRFNDAINRNGGTLRDCWDFIQFLKAESHMNSIEMLLDDTRSGRGWRTRFALNTKKQKDRESCIVRIRNQLDTNLTTMSQDEAVGDFLQQMVTYV